MSVLARSDNAAAQLFDRHSANAAAQLADAQSECKECAHAQSEREATAPQSAEMQGSVSCYALSSAARTVLALTNVDELFVK